MYAELKQKICVKCEETKTLDQFRFRAYKDRSPNHIGTCKTCERKEYKVWADKNKAHLKEKDFVRNLRKKFNLSKDEYNKMLADQGGGCSICKATKSLSGKALAVDHCHTTGKVRSLLCNECNTAIGLLKENTEIITSALEYIKKFKK